MPLADEWLMYKPDCCTPASTKTQTQTSRTNAKKVIDQIMGDASKSAQMYGSLDEFIPLHIDKLSMAKQREGKYQKKPKLKQPKVKLIERRRPQSATIVRNRYAQGRQIAPNLQHDAFRLGPYNTRRKKKQRPKKQRVYCIDIENRAQINMKLQLGHHHPIRFTQLDYEQRKAWVKSEEQSFSAKKKDTSRANCRGRKNGNGKSTCSKWISTRIPLDQHHPRLKKIRVAMLLMNLRSQMK